MAIEDIINESVVVDDNQEVVRLNLNKVPFSSKVKKSIALEFQKYYFVIRV